MIPSRHFVDLSNNSLNNYINLIIERKQQDNERLCNANNYTSSELANSLQGSQVLAIPALPKKRKANNIIINPKQKQLKPYDSNISCCKKLNCSAKFSNAYIEILRENFYNKSKTDQKVWLQQQKHSVAGLQSNNVSSLPVFHLDGLRVCSEFICKALNISLKKLYSKPIAGPPLANRKAYKTEETIMWLDRHSKVQEVMPHIQKDTIQFCYPDKASVYEIYKQDDSVLDKKVCKSFFMAVWRKYRKNYILRRHLILAKCSTCETIRKE